MRQLLPFGCDPVDPAVLYGDLPPARTRPTVRLNMIASIDGATAVAGLSGGLGGPADQALFAVLRSQADLVLVAAGTVRAEHYGPSPVPVAVISRSCRLDWDSPFFTAAITPPYHCASSLAASGSISSGASRSSGVAGSYTSAGAPGVMPANSAAARTVERRRPPGDRGGADDKLSAVHGEEPGVRPEGRGPEADPGTEPGRSCRSPGKGRRPVCAPRHDATRRESPPGGPMRSQRCRSKLSCLFRLAGRAGVTRQLGLPSLPGGKHQGPFGERKILFSERA